MKQVAKRETENIRIVVLGEGGTWKNRRWNKYIEIRGKQDKNILNSSDIKIENKENVV